MRSDKFTDSDCWYYNLRRENIVSLIPKGVHSVLDIGCGSGKLGEQLLAQGRAKEMIGVEIVPAAARAAAAIYTRVIEGDIECTDLAYSQHFDYIVCADVLEHLADPWKLVSGLNAGCDAVDY